MRGIGVRDAEVEALNARIKELEEELARLEVRYDVELERVRAARDELARALLKECLNRKEIHEGQRDPTGERLWDELEHRGAVYALAGMARVIEKALETVPSLSSEATKGET